MCLRHDSYMHAKRGYAHHNCTLLCTQFTAFTPIQHGMNPDALPTCNNLLHMLKVATVQYSTLNCL